METSIGALVSTFVVQLGNKTALVVNSCRYSLSKIDHLSSAVATRLRSSFIPLAALVIAVLSRSGCSAQANHQRAICTDHIVPSHTSLRTATFSNL